MVTQQLERAIGRTRQVYRWIVETPSGAVVGSFVALLLIALVGSVAIHPLSFQRWVKLFREFLIPLPAFFGAVVWFRRSSIGEKIKPSWMSWPGFAGLALQVVIGGVLGGVIIANWLGYLHTVPGAQLWPPALCVLPWTICAIAIAVGIYRNRWWAFLLEVPLLWLAIIGAYTDPTPSVPSHRLAIEIPFMHDFHAMVEWIGFAMFNLWLIRKGCIRFREQKLERRSQVA